MSYKIECQMNIFLLSVCPPIVTSTNGSRHYSSPVLCSSWEKTGMMSVYSYCHCFHWILSCIFMTCLPSFSNSCHSRYLVFLYRPLNNDCSFMLHCVIEGGFYLSSKFTLKSSKFSWFFGLIMHIIILLTWFCCFYSNYVTIFWLLKV